MEVILAIATLIGGASAALHFHEKWRQRAALRSTNGVLVPNQVNDLIYTGDAHLWPEIVDLYANAVSRSTLSPNERLTLVVSYDIARVRRLKYSDSHLIFFDSSWLSHDFAFWNSDPNMQRWLRELCKVSAVRAKTGRRTTRVFYWRPAEVVHSTSLLAMAATVMEHINHGIEVYLVDPDNWPKILDIQLFSTTDGITSDDFGEFALSQLRGKSDTDEGFTRFDDTKRLIASNDALSVPLNTKTNEVVRLLAVRCPNAEVLNSSLSNIG